MSAATKGNPNDVIEKFISISKELNLNNANNELISRVDILKKYFETEYEKKPEFIVKVPGRVNIIGEHVDYCGYPVLPMAIDQCILLAVSTTNDGFLCLKNIDKKYENYKCKLDSMRIDVPVSGSPKWFNYFLCGVKGILEYLGENSSSNNGFYVAISGNVPPASGLSSSSALVCSGTLATAYINKVPLEKRLLATISAKSERFIGTQGGGMDQAIAFLAKKGCAQYIEFHPKLNSYPVELPSNAYFVVANSLAEINKAATSDFNERVVECRLACHILAKKLKLSNWKKVSKFAVLQSFLKSTLEELKQSVLDILDKEIFNRSDILEELNINDGELVSDFLTPNTKDMQTFKLRQRALHVIEESLRVKNFRSICDSGNSDITLLSKAMIQSHNSLRNLYECSHPNLDKLTELSNYMGIGSRLTGAGWGGSVIAMCNSAEQCQAFIENLKENYYKNLSQAKGLNLNDIIFITTPQNGAEIFLC